MAIIFEYSKDFDEDRIEKDKKIPTRVQFAQDFLGIDDLRIFGKGKQFKKTGEIKRGTNGIIFETDNSDIIVKQPIDEEGKFGMILESAMSNLFVNEVMDELYQEKPNYEKIFRLGSIIPVLGETDGNSIIQRKVNGVNLEKTVQDHISPYTRNGYPDNLTGAIKRAIGFYRGLSTFHSFRFVHCDIKPLNTMILSDELNDFPSLIIDLGEMKKEGKGKMITSSGNRAPESYFDDTPQLSFDIYASASSLIALLFGEEGVKWAHDLYFPYCGPCPSRIPYYINIIAPSFQNDTYEKKQYFRAEFRKLNQRMGEETGQEYQSDILEQLADLQGEISSTDPDDRPSASQICEKLENIYFLYTQRENVEPINTNKIGHEFKILQQKNRENFKKTLQFYQNRIEKNRFKK